MQVPLPSFLQKGYDLACRLARADTVFYLLPALMAVLVIGTLAQRSMGFYEAYRTFFAAAVFWAGPVPLPGGYLLISLISIILAFKFFFRSEWSFRKVGSILTHLGVLVLLGGGLITTLSAKEGYMAIPEGVQSPYVYDYIQRDLFIFKDDILHKTVSFQDLRNNQTIQMENVPFEIQVHSACENCNIIKREDSEEEFGNAVLQGMAAFMALTNKPKEKDPEINLSGLTFSINGTGTRDDEEQNGVYIAFENMPEPIEIIHKGQQYRIMFGKAQRKLPFSVRLQEFKKENYPGLSKARSYRSDIVVIDDDLEWPARIEMNKPLRYKGYTFYQSSFEQTPEEKISILSVVENQGRLFPYIGSLIITAGLLAHIFITLAARKAE